MTSRRAVSRQPRRNSFFHIAVVPAAHAVPCLTALTYHEREGVAATVQPTLTMAHQIRDPCQDPEQAESAVLPVGKAPTPASTSKEPATAACHAIPRWPRHGFSCDARSARRHVAHCRPCDLSIVPGPSGLLVRAGAGATRTLRTTRGGFSAPVTARHASPARCSTNGGLKPRKASARAARDPRRFLGSTAARA